MNLKKAVVNPRNEHDNFCFAYAATITIYHKELGKNPSIISNKLIEYTEKLDWNRIDFPAATPDYKRMKNLMKILN